MMLQRNHPCGADLEEWGFKTRDISFGTLKCLENIRLGLLPSHQYRCRIDAHLAASHIVSDVTIHRKDQIPSTFVTHADVEAVDYRYLLCGLNDGGVAIYDTSTVKEGRVYAEAGVARGGQRGGHKHAVQCIQWYPADTGLFATSCGDKTIKLWDTNRVKPVDQFKLDCCVGQHHMSPVATKHSLLAASADTGEIILCDLRTGSSSHRIVAHEAAIQVTRWSPRMQHVLVSGGSDHAIKVWDVRSAKGCLLALDMDDMSFYTKHSRKRMKKNPVAHKSIITSLCFSSDGLWLLSFSYDGALKLWNSSTGENMNVVYGPTFTDLKRGFKMAVSHLTYPELVFIPCKSRIVTYELFTGKLVNVLEGHLATALGVLYNPISRDLYSFGADRNFITWTPKTLLTTEDIDESVYDGASSSRPLIQRITQDSWSDED